MAEAFQLSAAAERRSRRDLKFCPKCRRFRLRTTSFHKSYRRADGLQGYCRFCQKARDKLRTRAAALKLRLVRVTAKLCGLCGSLAHRVTGPKCVRCGLERREDTQE